MAKASRVAAKQAQSLERLEEKIDALAEKIERLLPGSMEVLNQAEELEVPQLEVISSKLDEALRRLGMDAETPAARTQAKKPERMHADASKPESKPAAGAGKK